jgi:hypothetical protein
MGFVAVILIIIGLLNVFARDLVWKITAVSKGMEGVQLQRTPAWDTRQIGAGLALAVLGVILIVREVRSPALTPRPYPGAVAYRRGSDPAVEDAIARQELSADELGGIDWYRVPTEQAAPLTEADIKAYYARETSAGTCEGGAKSIVICNGPDKTARFRTVTLSADELLLGVY